jgi:hypothetical protein
MTTGFIILFYLLVLTSILILANPRVYFLITAAIVGLMGFAHFILGLPLSVSGYH